MPGAVLVDSNVILDVATEDRAWFAWSAAALQDSANVSVLVINPIVYAEVSVRYATIEALEAALVGLRRDPLPWEGAFLAGKAFLQYRRRGGMRTSTLPDFYIGAHAAIAGMTLLTRDPRRYRTYFPTLEIIAP
ncbi:MAG TPA: type II toxin-antitoxin system VapC family toxin [Gemmatimonadaceae bacterium]